METARTATGRSSRTRRSRSASIPRASRSSATLRTSSRRRSATGFGADLCIVSGGLGPTHDDRTVEMVARAAGVGLVVDEGLEARDRGCLAVVRGAPRQAVRRLRPRRAEAGDAPRGRSLDRPRRNRARLRAARPGARPSSCLPGPPGELQRLWPARARDRARPRRSRARPPPRAADASPLRRERVVGRTDAARGGWRRRRRRRHRLRARLRDPRRRARQSPAPRRVRRRSSAPCGPSTSGTCSRRTSGPVEEIVLALCRALGLTIGTAESCTGGLVGERLTSVAGASDVYLGGVVAYADSVKEEPARRLRRPALASTVRSRRRRRPRWLAACASGSGPTSASRSPVSPDRGAGRPEKPVGLVFIHAEAPRREPRRRTSAIRAIATRFAGARLWRCCTWRDESCHRIGTNPRDRRRYGGGSWTSAHLLWPHASGGRARCDRRVATRFPPR